MDQNLETIHHRILSLEQARRILYTERSAQIADFSLNHGIASLPGDRNEFAGAIAQIEGELYQLWAAKRLLLTEEKSQLLRRQPGFKNWSWLSPMIGVSAPSFETSPTPVLGMDF